MLTITTSPSQEVLSELKLLTGTELTLLTSVRRLPWEEWWSLTVSVTTVNYMF